MNKEEILEKSRAENKNRDIAELEVIKNAGSISNTVALLACCVLSVLQVVFNERVNFGCWVIFFSILGTKFLVKYIKLKRKHELAVAMLYIALCVFFLGLYILSIAGVFYG